MYKYDSDNGLLVGLKMWLLCIIVLLCLGVSPILCILFGATAGASVWRIVAYWNFEPIPKGEEEEKPVVDEPIPSVFSRLRLPTVASEKIKIPSFFNRKPRRRI